MRIKNIVLIILLGNLLLLAGIQIAISKLVIYPGFIDIENNSAVRNLDRSKDAITRELYHLEIITKDWGYWDDTYEFIEDKNEKFRESCLSDDSFITNNLQVVYFLDTQGKIIWHQIYGLEEEQIQSTHQVVSELVEQFLSEETVKGLISTDVAPLLLVSCGIYNTEHSKPSRGRLVMGRFLDRETVNDLIQQTHVKFEIQPLNPDFHETSTNPSLGSDDYFIETHPADLIASSVYEDLHGQPTWLIRTTQDRTITAAGKRVIYCSVIVTTFMLLVLAVLLLCALHRFIIRPIMSLTEQIHHLRKRKKLDQPVRVLHGYETKALAKQFNRLMRRVNWDRRKRLCAEQCMLESIQKEQHANHAKSEFLANMSHELRTPMNSILGFTELILQEDLTDEQKDYLRIVYNNGQSLLRLINDVLDMSKIESGNMELECLPCSPFEIAHSLRELIRPLAVQKKLDYKVITASDLPAKIIADPLRLRQILINLVGNAIKFTSQGHVYLNIYRSRLDQNQVVCFSVEDTGIGIPVHSQHTIFESFRQADSSTTRKFGGSGLGLTIAKQLSELMGGILGVQSEPGKGTVFTLSIPIQSEIEFDSHADLEASKEDVICVRECD